MVTGRASGTRTCVAKAVPSNAVTRQPFPLWLQPVATLDNELHLSKALSWMMVTDVGMSTLANELQ